MEVTQSVIFISAKTLLTHLLSGKKDIKLRAVIKMKLNGANILFVITWVKIHIGIMYKSATPMKLNRWINARPKKPSFSVNT